MENFVNRPRISVVVPSFNQAGYLGATLESVIAQNYPNLELIVIDGGSGDGSVEILRQYAPHLDFWVSEPDRGQTDALIKGFARASGDIFCWLNSDDLLEPGTLAEVADFFVSNPRVDAVFGDALWIDAGGRPLRRQREIPFNRFLWLHTYNYIPGMSMFWRREIYQRAGGLNPDFNLAMDADLWIRIADIGRIGHVRRVWSRMRFYPEQKNRRLRAASDAEDQRIRARYWGSERPLLYRTKKAVALAIRVAWKLATGCYPIGYKRHMDRP